MVRTSPGLWVLVSLAGCATTVRTPAPAPACRANCAAEAQAAPASTPPASTPPASTPPASTPPASTPPAAAPASPPPEPLAADASTPTASPAASAGLHPLVGRQAGLTGAFGGLSGLTPSGGPGAHHRGTPVLTVGVPTVGPALSADVIRRIIHRRRPLLRSCYTRALATRPTLAGRVRVRFAIGPNGDVTTVDVTTGLEPGVDACLAKVLRSTTFPAPVGGGVVIVTYPFTFAPPAGP